MKADAKHTLNGRVFGESWVHGTRCDWRAVGPDDAGWDNVAAAGLAVAWFAFGIAAELGAVVTDGLAGRARGVAFGALGFGGPGIGGESQAEEAEDGDSKAHVRDERPGGRTWEVWMS